MEKHEYNAPKVTFDTEFDPDVLEQTAIDFGDDELEEPEIFPVTKKRRSTGERKSNTDIPEAYQESILDTLPENESNNGNADAESGGETQPETILEGVENNEEAQTDTSSESSDETQTDMSAESTSADVQADEEAEGHNGEDTEEATTDVKNSDTPLSENELTDEDRSSNATESEASDAAEESEPSTVYDETEDAYSLRFFDEDGNGEKEPPEDEEEKDIPPYDPEKPRRVDTRFDFVELFIFTLVVVMVITSFFFRHSIVEGPSMEGTLYEGEHLIISDFLYTPKRGDIIVCQDYTTSLKKPIVKRIIAVGGDIIKITRNGDVYVNGTEILEGYVYIDDPGYKYQELFLTVPEGDVFVMGDHRNNSTDSRAESVGTISEDSILGRVILRFLPFDRFGRVD